LFASTSCSRTVHLIRYLFYFSGYRNNRYCGSMPYVLYSWLFITAPSVAPRIETTTVSNNNVCLNTVTVSARSHPSCFFCLLSVFFSPSRVGVKWGCQAATAASSSWFSSSTSCSGSSVSGSSLSGKDRKMRSGSALDLLSSAMLWVRDLIFQA
jgi:hypothetical protein